MVNVNANLKWVLVVVLVAGVIIAFLSSMNSSSSSNLLESKSTPKASLSFVLEPHEVDEKHLLSSYYQLYPNHNSSNSYKRVIESKRWSLSKAKTWYKKQPWIIGCNYIPATAINQLEMWQNDTFDVVTIEKEAKLAESIGFNTFRVFLHDLLWTPSQRQTFLSNIEKFLSIMDKHHIKVIFALFDDCHRNSSSLIQLGTQPLPISGVHNSGWLQSPGSEVVLRIHEKNDSRYLSDLKRLQEYVVGIMKVYKNDPRVLMWDIYNEPGRNDLGNQSLALLQYTWQWAHSVRPKQPITAALDGSVSDENIRFNEIMSDVITFHVYQRRYESLRINNRISRSKKRPIICTEYMARPLGSTFEYNLPVFKAKQIGAINWGFVQGKTQTIWKWTTIAAIEEKRANSSFVYPGQPYPEPDVWFHDIFRLNGSAYDHREVELIKKMTADNTKF